MRGAGFTLGSGNVHESFSASCKGHLLDFARKYQRRVTRSTLPAEFFGACDASDRAILLALIVHRGREKLA